jgi:hypothetical protein
VDWYNVWLYPCAFAAVVMAIFFLAFWDRVDESDAPSGH